MLIVPTLATPSQTLNAQLNNQNCNLNIYQKFYGLFMDVYLGTTLVIGGVACWYNNLIVRSAYLGFIGDFVWTDTQGQTDPVYTGLNDRYFLLYLAPSDIASLSGVPPQET